MTIEEAKQIVSQIDLSTQLKKEQFLKALKLVSNAPLAKPVVVGE